MRYQCFYLTVKASNATSEKEVRKFRWLAYIQRPYRVNSSAQNVYFPIKFWRKTITQISGLRPSVSVSVLMESQVSSLKGISWCSVVLFSWTGPIALRQFSLADTELFFRFIKISVDRFYIFVHLSCISLAMFENRINWSGFILTCKINFKRVNTEHLIIQALA